MSLLDAFRLRPIIGIHRELRRLNDSLDAILLHFQIPTKQETLSAIKSAREEADRIEKNPSLLDVPTPAQLAAEELRERAKRHEPIEPAELLRVAEELQEEEEDADAAW
jgi:hypothetical protein